ncbi:MAG: hypothetical protein M1482_18260 [Chloroflexi bacterium]|nr:hypothetical protein [Chloroflexota bacterium]
MKKSILVPAVLGLVFCGGIYAGAVLVSSRIPVLVQGAFGEVVLFLFLLCISVAEMPLMLFGLRLMAHSPSTARPLLAGIFAVYVTFAGVYASVFVLLTGEFLWGLALAALGVARSASGALVR